MEKVYIRSQILERTSIGEYKDISLYLVERMGKQCPEVILGWSGAFKNGGKKPEGVTPNPSGWIMVNVLQAGHKFSAQKSKNYQNFVKITHAVSWVTAPILGLFVLIWVHFSWWIQTWQSKFEFEFFFFFWKSLKI